MHSTWLAVTIDYLGRIEVVPAACDVCCGTQPDPRDCNLWHSQCHIYKPEKEGKLELWRALSTREDAEEVARGVYFERADRGEEVTLVGLLPEPPRFFLHQTRNGAFSSVPRVADVHAYMAGDEEWEVIPSQVGHGEYVGNVCAVAVECERTGEMPEQVIARAEILYV